MFYHRKHNHAHGFLFLLGLFVAFLLGRKSEQYGYTIISRGCRCNDDDDEMDMMDDSDLSSPSYPR